MAVKMRKVGRKRWSHKMNIFLCSSSGQGAMTSLRWTVHSDKPFGLPWSKRLQLMLLQKYKWWWCKLSFPGAEGGFDPILSFLGEELREMNSLSYGNMTNRAGCYGKNLANTIIPLSVKLLQSCLTICSPMDCSPPGSSVYGIIQARILEWVIISTSRRSSRPRDRTHVSCIIGRFFATLTAKKHYSRLPPEKNEWDKLL